MSMAMQIFSEKGVEASYGLAFDEAMAQECGAVPGAASMLRLYSYRDHCVLVGRFQRIEAEVDLRQASRLGIGVNRRPTGGGAILMGSGQIGVALALPAATFASPRAGFYLFADAVVAGLAAAGVQACLRGKNDIEVAGRKIAGLGFCVSGTGLLFHASILEDLDLELMAALLMVPLSKLDAHGPGGISSRITTLMRELGGPIDSKSFAKGLIGAFEEVFDLRGIESEPPASLLGRAARLEADKYSTESWLFDGGRASSGEFLADCRSALGTLRLVVASQGALIKSVLVTGDFNEAPATLISLEESLRWTVIDGAILERRLRDNPMVEELLDAAELAEAICTSYAALAETAGPRRTGSCYLVEEKIS